MKLKKFKLIDNGNGGIEIEGIEYSLTKNRIIIPDDVKRKRNIGFDLSSIATIAKLKYYFLNLTGHWIEPYNKYYDRSTHTRVQIPETGPVPVGLQSLVNILNKVDITGVSTTENSFLITGTIISYGDKKIGLSTRNVTEDDDAGFYSEAMGIIDEIFLLITTFFKENMLPATSEPKQYLSQYADSNKEDFNNLSKEELVNRAIDELQKRGAIILMPDGGDTKIEVDRIEDSYEISQRGNKITQGDLKTTIDTRTGSIDGNNLEEVSGKIDPEKTENDREFSQENISEEDIKAALGDIVTEDIAPPEKSPKVKKKKEGSSLASEKDFAEATGQEIKEDPTVDLTSAEFSDNGGSHETDDWSDNVTDESEISSIDFGDSTQN